MLLDLGIRTLMWCRVIAVGFHVQEFTLLRNVCYLPSSMENPKHGHLIFTWKYVIGLSRNSMQIQIHRFELKDLSELEVGDLDAREEVLEFLDYWGLINFHPFPGTDSLTNDDSDEAEKEKLLKKLVQFEESQQCLTFFPRLDPTTPAVPSGLFPDSAIPEELAKMEGPSVEYHCNSCSADCSRKRYHCQKQVFE